MTDQLRLYHYKDGPVNIEEPITTYKGVFDIMAPTQLF
jgi:hypothetical protein